MFAARTFASTRTLSLKVNGTRFITTIPTHGTTSNTNKNVLVVKGCAACGAKDHGVGLCKVRAKHAAKVPCYACQGAHWRSDCKATPLTAKEKEALSFPVLAGKVLGCQACGGRHSIMDCKVRKVAENLPKAQCPRCKTGNHWAPDCSVALTPAEIKKHSELRVYVAGPKPAAV